MGKSILRTIRFSLQEAQEIQAYLRQNPPFESISSLGRVAIMEFIRTHRALPLHPILGAASQRPSFLWDYDLTQAQAEEILRHAPFEQRKWLIARILEQAPFEEVFKYLTLEQIKDALPHLRIKPKTKQHWQEAIALWMNLGPQS